ncbi:MAG: glycosyltransferase [Bacteroides sp.]|nr:glycosyltransferase [Bacteroides sp.]MCM1095785.1 glycosyltransferase [Terasakiella sp.]
MNSPKVSIIVPVYNAEKFVTTAVKSLQSQSHDNLEIILVNDCSTDRSSAVCHKLASGDNRIIVIDKKANEGVDYARFTGISAATGEYIMFLDADDWYTSDAVEHLLNISRTHDVDIVYSNCIRVYSKKFNIKRYREFGTSFAEHVISGSEKDKHFISFCGVNHIPVTMWGNLFHHKLFTGDIKKSGLKFGEDLLLGMQLYYNADSVYVTNCATYNYRWGGDSPIPARPNGRLQSAFQTQT